MRLVRAAAVALVALAVAGCGRSPTPPATDTTAPAASTAPSAWTTPSAPTAAGATPAPTPGSPGTVELTVFAAASLKNVLEAVKTAYRAAAPGVALVVSTDSSAALEAQVEQGAPADVLLSADLATAQRLVDRGFAAGDAQPFAGNRLVVIVPAGSSAVATLADLARPGVKVIAAGDAVPVTGYANAVVTKLAAQPGYPAGFAAGYAANIVSKEDNARAVVARIELGEGDAAIVYETDAAASTKVATIPIPDAANVVATYAGVVVGASTHPAEAAALLARLQSAQAQAIFASFGFRPPAQ